MKTVKQNPMYQFLIVLTIASSVGLQAWLILFNNFAVEVAGLQGNHVIVSEGIAPGDILIVAGVSFLRDGQKVKPMSDSDPDQ